MEYVNLKDCAKYSGLRTNEISKETYISTENMLPNKGGITVVDTIPECKTTSKYEPKDILISNIRPYFCKIWYATREGGCSNDVLVIKANKGVDSKFLYYVLSDQNFFNYDTVTSKGTKMPRGNKNAIMKYLVPKVGLPTQQKIASILSTYDTLIENNTKRIRLLEQMAENLYKEWFVRFRFPGHENVEMENGLPKGWKMEKLGNVANISTGKCNREDAEQDGLYPLFDRSQEIKKSSTWLKDCEAVIVPGEGTSFIPRYFKGKFNLHQRCYCVEPTNEKTGKYLFFMLMMNRSYFLSVATGATVPSLRQNNFTKMSFVFPTIGLVQKFDNIVTNMFKEIDSLKERNILLTRQRDLLLPRLMSGKLEVKA